MIIADDENIIRESLFQFIDWEAIGIEVVGVADNGSKALEMILDKRPDIILSDISMPQLSGIEMLQILREKNIDSEIIFISAYSNFEYAKTAIQFGAFEYILKPINEIHLIEAVKRCADKINSAREFKSLLLDMSNDKELMLNDSLEKLFYAYNPLSPSEQKIIEASGLTFENYSTVIAAGVYNFSPPTHLIFDDFTVNLHGNNKLHMINAKDNLYVLLLFSQEKDLDFVHQAFFNYISSKKEFFIKNNVSFIAISKPYSFHEAFRFIAPEIFLLLVCGQNKTLFQILCFQDIQKYYKQISINDTLPQAKQAIKDNDINHLYEVITSIFIHSISDNTIYDVDIMKLKCIDFIDTLLDELNSYQLSNYFGDKHMTAKKNITSQKSINRIFEVTKNFLANISSLINENKNKSSNHLITLTLDYIHQNYNKNPSLSEISSKLYVSSPYLSMIFSREVGESFSRYVLNYRIQISKTLLQNPKYKIYEIAELTGFTDAAHFSKVFKQMEKKSPKKYQNM